MQAISLTAENQGAVAEAVIAHLKRGGVVAVPTDTVYGLIADILDASAVTKVFRIKERSHLKALPVFVRDIPMARQYAHIDAKLWRLLEELWPGQTTAVLRKRPAMPDLVTGGEKTVALRIPDHPLLATILEHYPYPLTGTSANLSGNEPAQSADEVRQVLGARHPRPDLLVDAGQLPPSPPSTVLDLTSSSNPKILRMGAITKEKLDEYLAQWRGQKNHAL
jgi:L-threonylcarbamoyladenylate synthase